LTLAGSRKGRVRTLCALLAIVCLAAATADAQSPTRTDDPDHPGDLPLLSIDSTHVVEGDAGTTFATFQLHLTSASTDTVSVMVATFDGTATVADGDYDPVSLRFLILPGSTAEWLSVAVHGDRRLEPDEWFGVQLANATHANLADTAAVATIVNDDQPVLAVSDTSLAEGDAGVQPMAFRIRLLPPMPFPVAIHYETVDRTAAAADSDYVAVAGDTLFAPGESQIVVEVPVLGDTLLEENERFVLRVTSGQAVADSGVGSILNDDRTTFARVSVNVPMYPYGTLPPSWGDFDGDGRPDLPLYLDATTQFTEMPGVRSILGNGNYHGSAWCDYDRDGVMDLVQLPYGDDSTPYNKVHLLHNGPSGFHDVAHELGMDITGYGETPTWADFNADGWPDLYMPFYGHEPPFHSFLWMNNGDGTFHEAEDSAGVSLRNVPATKKPEGIGVVDWNGDGALDFYVANHLFLNDGDAHFTDVRAGVGLPVMFDEGAQFVDYDDDGDFDLYVRTSQGPTLFRNDNGHFTNVTPQLGIGFVDWEWGDRWADVDLDGDLDLLYFPPGAVARLMLNNGDGTFTLDTTFTGIVGGSSLSSFADFDGDGDIDIAVGANGRQIVRNLFETHPHEHTSFLKVRVEDDDGRWVEQGATVRLRSLDDPKHPVQSRIVDGGSGYLGQDEYTLTFGGVESGRFDLEVSFPAKPGSPRVVGPAQNPALGGLRPGAGDPQLLVVHPNGLVAQESVRQPVSGTPPPEMPPPIIPWQVMPNPAKSLVRFSAVPSDGAVRLTIHDLSGRQIRAISGSGRFDTSPGLVWDLKDESGRTVPPGLYFARLERQNRAAGIQRIVVVR
jgi:hypothetical protein